MTLDKAFDPTATEPRLYEGWEREGAFACNPNSNAAPFTIMIPPPNVTGSLHMGHALTFTVQDTLIRYRRMMGRDALWQPGTDHAGIATQMVVERLLAAEKVDRRDLGRDKFLERVWQWKAESGGTIAKQLRRLGASLDWPRERFTMDDGLSTAVREVFVTLFRQGLIYRDRRLVNWDPKLQTAISDLEVENKEVRSSLWYLRYPIEGAPGQFVVVATTRPETMLGDTAVAVHPEHPAMAGLIGKRAILPLTGRAIPIVADTYADPEKGTGAVKITPAHDFNDFEVGRRHDLPAPSVLDQTGHVTLAEIEDSFVAIDGIADPAFVRGLAGMERFAARKAIVAELERLELVEKIEPHTHQVPHGDRGGVPIEPRLTTQWYCNAGELAKPAIAAVETGKTVFVPKQWENTFFAWMRDIQPWCISRQLWWGHRIPAWYGPDGTVFVAKSEGEAKEQAIAYYGEEKWVELLLAAGGGTLPLVQDEDVLDTWFSSALWPFSTLGWPEKTAEVARYYPGDVLVTGFDIIFFWVARMMMMGIHFMGDVPFKTVYIHGLVRDERGQKMSKSKGNAMDPLELIDSYGADALRFAICALTGPGRDVKLGESRVKDFRSFVTKLWNAARFCEMNNVRIDPDFDPSQVRSPLCRWILDAANRAAADAAAALDDFRFDEYAQAGYRFVWNTYCDWFLEFAKPAFAEGADPAAAAEVRATAAHVMGTILRILHPSMPFVTEELWHRFGYGAEWTLIRAAWPVAVDVPGAADARAELDWVVRLIGLVRSVRTEMNVPPSALAPVLLKDASPESMARAERWLDAIRRMARASEVKALAGGMPPDSAQAVLDEATVVLPLAGLIDLVAERKRLAGARDKALAEVRKVVQKLGNADFVARAKPEVVEENRERQVSFQAEAARLSEALARLQ